MALTVFRVYLKENHGRSLNCLSEVLFISAFANAEVEIAHRGGMFQCHSAL